MERNFEFSGNFNHENHEEGLSMTRISKRIVLLTGCALLVTGCTITPKAITPQEAQETATQLHSRVQVPQEPLPQALTLDEAIARVLKYNLEHRLKMFEVSLAQRQFDLSMYDMLPQLTAKGDRRYRSNWDASTSRNLRTGINTTDYTTSDDRSKVVGELALSWNILDLGVSYYATHQQANRFLIAKEQQRKVVQDLASETRTAFFKVLVAQQLQDEISKVLKQAESALATARSVENERLRPLEEILNYQKNLLQMIRQMEELAHQLSLAKVQLGALMNLPSDHLPRLEAPAWYGLTRKIDLTREQMENYAFSHRPEIFEWSYQRRITALEAKKAIFDLVPGLGLSLSANYDSNSFDMHSSWQQASVHVAYNLMNLVKWPAKQKTLDVQEEMDEARGLAVGMAVLSQVNLAAQQHEFAAQIVNRAKILADVEARLKELSTRQVSQGQGMRLDVIQKSISAITGYMNREQSFINYYQSLNNLFTALGVDYLDYSNLPRDLQDLTGAVAKANDKLWGNGDMAAWLALPASTTAVEQAQ